MSHIPPNARPNPIIGERKSDSMISTALCQCGALPPSHHITIETQRIEPMSVCELDAGIARYQVPKFQIIDERRRADMTAIPYPVGSPIICSIGSRWIIPIATAVPPIATPRKLKKAAIITDFFGERELV
jgi:hypothetical protein